MTTKTTLAPLCLLLASACGATVHHDTAVPGTQPIAMPHPAALAAAPRAETEPIFTLTTISTIDPVVAERMNELMHTDTALYAERDPFVDPTLSAACGWDHPTVYFSTDHANLGLVQDVKLEAVAACLEHQPLADQPIVVMGYADPRGSKYDNLELGLKRANAVKDELVSLGVSPDRIETYSRGEYFVDPEAPLQEDRRAVVMLDR